jgi:hypothetical protein
MIILKIIGPRVYQVKVYKNIFGKIYIIINFNLIVMINIMADEKIIINIISNYMFSDINFNSFNLLILFH